MTIAEEIIEAAERDQEMRRKTVEDPSQWNTDIDKKNTLRMKEIVAEIGWPSVSKVGADASNKAWLIVQHADHDRAFQKECLELMKALPKQEVLQANIAYLEDRVLVGLGLPQRYGTQFYRNEAGEMCVRPIEERERVDERRALMGLEPFKDKK